MDFGEQNEMIPDVRAYSNIKQVLKHETDLIRLKLAMRGSEVQHGSGVQVQHGPALSQRSSHYYSSLIHLFLATLLT